MDFFWISMDFLWISLDVLRISGFCNGKHNDLELIANFALVSAGIAAGTHEIHIVFDEKMLTK